jgi:hypothetical protein
METRTEVTGEVMDIIVVKGTSSQQEKILCECEMRIFIQRTKK